MNLFVELSFLMFVLRQANSQFPIQFTIPIPGFQQEFNETTLTLLHVFSRHGDRTPSHLYPNDPYTVKDFYPYKFGDLTNVGKMRASKIGEAIQKSYGAFLGEYYSPRVVNGISSPLNRCKESLILAISGIFPARGFLKWIEYVIGRPIYYEYNDFNDKLFMVYKSCPNFKIFQDERLQSEETKAALAPHQEVIMYTRNRTGDFTEKYTFMYNIYSTLRAEVEYGLPLPEWTQHVFPEAIANAAKVELDQMYKGKNQILGAGYVMRKIATDTLLTLNNDWSVRGRKLYIYSGHDMNIVAILSWLEVNNPHLPAYGSYIVFEIHKFDNKPYIKIMYENYESTSPLEVSIPGCGVMCPFYTFLKIYEKRLNPDPLCM